MLQVFVAKIYAACIIIIIIIIIIITVIITITIIINCITTKQGHKNLWRGSLQAEDWALPKVVTGFFPR